MPYLSKAYFLLVFSGLLFSCNPDRISVERNSEGVIIRTPFNWRTRISDGPRGSNLYRGYTIPSKGILYVGTKHASGPVNHSYLGVKDFETGKDVWIWNGFFNNILRRTLRDHIVIEDDKILVHDLQANYLVNALDGTEIWKRERFGSTSTVTGAGGLFFIAAQAPGFDTSKIEEDMVFQGKIMAGEITSLVKPSYNREFIKKENGYFSLGYLWRNKAFIQNEDIMLIVPYLEAGPPAKLVDNRAFWGLYNVSQEKWVYDRIPLSFKEDGGASSVTPIVTDDKVYLTSLATVGCYELATGKRIWQKRVTEDNTDVMDIILVGDRLLANTGNATLYCLNAETGSVFWTQKSSGMSSDMYHQDGVVYWIPSKNLRAVDIVTGKMLWDLPAMDKEEDSHWWGFVTGVPGKSGEKGKIYATSDLYMYSFDAAR